MVFLLDHESVLTGAILAQDGSSRWTRTSISGFKVQRATNCTNEELEPG